MYFDPFILLALLPLGLLGVFFDGGGSESDDDDREPDVVTEPEISSEPSEGDDRILGGSLEDSINSLAGNDEVFLRGGNDAADGGTGNDRILGGDGDDTPMVEDFGS